MKKAFRGAFWAYSGACRVRLVTDAQLKASLSGVDRPAELLTARRGGEAARRRRIDLNLFNGGSRD